MPLKKLSGVPPQNPARLKVRHALARHGWRSRDVARLAGVSDAAVSQFFCGKINESARIERAITKLLTHRNAA